MMPEAGADLPFDELQLERLERLARLGFHPLKKRVGDKEYLIMRRGDRTFSFGPYTEEKFKVAKEISDKYAAEREMEKIERELREEAELESVKRYRRRDEGGGTWWPKPLTAGIGKPAGIPTTFRIHPEILWYYEWARQRGYDRPLDMFLQECTKAYFRSQGIYPAMVVPKALATGAEEESEAYGWGE